MFVHYPSGCGRRRTPTSWVVSPEGAALQSGGGRAFGSRRQVGCTPSFSCEEHEATDRADADIDGPGGAEV